MKFYNPFTQSRLFPFVLSKAVPASEKRLQLRGRWVEVRSHVKRAYANIADQDLNYQEGQEEELLLTLQHKTGHRREELIQWINQLVRTVF